MRKLIGTTIALLLAGCAPTIQAPTTAPAVADFQSMSPAEQARLQSAGAQVLFWSDAERSANFRTMETIFPGMEARNTGAVRALPKGVPLKLAPEVLTAAIADQQIAGIMVLQDGKVRYEGSGLGFNADGRWTSFSVAKSFTSTLVGAAVQDGFITSLGDPVTKYVPELKGSGYDGATVEQILTMTSGVKWNEDYTDPNSDVARMLSVPVKPGQDPNVQYLASLPSEAAPGTKWVYKTGETNLIGVIVARATGKSLAAYAQDKIVTPAGFKGPLFWMVDSVGQNIGGCCLSLRLDDYARMGQFVLEGGKGQVPADWFAKASAAHAPIGLPGFGYGYQWWTYPGNTYGAQGIFGQGILIVPEKNAVIAVVSNWPKASGRDVRMKQFTLMQKILAGLE